MPNLDPDFQILTLLDQVVSGFLSEDSKTRVSACEAAAGTGDPCFLVAMEKMQPLQADPQALSRIREAATLLRDNPVAHRTGLGYQDYRALEFSKALICLGAIEELIRGVIEKGGSGKGALENDLADALSLLKVVVLLEENPLLREKALRGVALASALEPEAMGFVTPFLRHRNARVRGAAINALALTREPMALMLLARFAPDDIRDTNLKDLENAFFQVPWTTMAVALNSYIRQPGLAESLVRLMELRFFSPVSPLLWDIAGIQDPSRDKKLISRAREVLKRASKEGLAGESFLHWVNDFPKIPAISTGKELKSLGGDDLGLWLENAISGPMREQDREKSLKLLLDRDFLEGLESAQRGPVLAGAGRMCSSHPSLCATALPALVELCGPKGGSFSFRVLAGQALAMLPPRDGIDDTVTSMSAAGDLNLSVAACRVAARHCPGRLTQLLTDLSANFGRRGEALAAALAGELRVRDWISPLASLLSSSDETVRDNARRSLEKLSMAGTDQAVAILREQESGDDSRAHSLVHRLRRHWISADQEMGAWGEELSTALFELSSSVEGNRINALGSIENLAKGEMHVPAAALVRTLDQVVGLTVDSSMAVREKAFKVCVALKKVASSALEVERPAPAGMPGLLFRNIFRYGVRSEKIRTLHSLIPGCRELVEAAMEALGEEGDSHVRASLCRHIGLAGNSDDALMLQPFFGDGDGRVRANAVEGLVLAAGEKAFSMIVPMLRDSFARVQRNVRNGLGLLEPATAADTLVELSRSPEPDLRIFAAYTMGIFGQKNSMVYVGILKTMFSRESSRNVCARIVKSLARIYAPYPESVSSTVFKGLISRETVGWKRAMLEWGMEKSANRDPGSMDAYVSQHAEEDDDDTPLDPRFAFTTIMELPKPVAPEKDALESEASRTAASDRAADSEASAADEVKPADQEASEPVTELEASLMAEASKSGQKAIDAIKAMGNLGEDVSPPILAFLEKKAAGGGSCDRLSYFAFRSLKSLAPERAAALRSREASTSEDSYVPASGGQGLGESPGQSEAEPNLSESYAPSVSLAEMLFAAGDRSAAPAKSKSQEPRPRVRPKEKAPKPTREPRPEKPAPAVPVPVPEPEALPPAIAEEPRPLPAVPAVDEESGVASLPENEKKSSASAPSPSVAPAPDSASDPAPAPAPVPDPEPSPAPVPVAAGLKPGREKPGKEKPGEKTPGVMAGFLRNAAIFLVMLLLAMWGYRTWIGAVNDSLVRQGLLMARQGDFQTAGKMMTEAWNRGGRRPEILAVMADMHTWNGNRRDSERLVDALGREFPDSPQYQRFLARTELMGHRVQEAMDSYGRILASNPDYCRARYEYALALREAGMVDKALEEVNRILAQEPDNLDSLVLMATMAEEKGDLPGALKWADKAAAVNSAYPLILIRKASVFYRMGRYRESADFYARAQALYAKLGWNSSELQYPMALALIGDNRRKEAEELLRQHMKARPDDLEAGLSLGVLLGSQNRRSEEMEIYRDLLEKRPGEHRLLYNMALVYYNNGDEAEALKYFEESARVRNDFAQAIFNSAVLRQRAGDLNGARRHYQRVCQLEPGNEKAAALLRDLEQKLQKK